MYERLKYRDNRRRFIEYTKFARCVVTAARSDLRFTRTAEMTETRRNVHPRADNSRTIPENTAPLPGNSSSKVLLRLPPRFYVNLTRDLLLRPFAFLCPELLFRNHPFRPHELIVSIGGVVFLNSIEANSRDGSRSSLCFYSRTEPDRF